MATPFNLELKDIQKRLGKEEDSRLELAKKMQCPKCKIMMVDGGCVGIRNMKGEEASLNGDYCMACYSRWLSSNIPKYEMPELQAGNKV